jgi:hypothetical protein
MFHRTNWDTSWGAVPIQLDAVTGTIAPSHPRGDHVPLKWTLWTIPLVSRVATSIAAATAC